MRQGTIKAWRGAAAAMLLGGAVSSAAGQELPRRARPDAARTEAAGSPEAQRAFDHRNADQLPDTPSREVRHAAALLTLPADEAGQAALVAGDLPASVDRFMARNSVAGFLAIRDGRVLIERYRLGNREATLWPVQSDSKSVTSTLVGAAVRDGAIRSIDDPVVRYLPELAGSAYDGTTIRNLLQMSSGVDLHDSYADPKSDYARLQRAYDDRSPDAVFAFLRTLRRAATPGTRFSYNGADTYVLGRIVARATGRPLATYLGSKVWAPLGMEYDAAWLTDANGHELAAGGLRVTLRDMGRFGVFVANDGRIGKAAVVPPGWFKDGARAVSGDRLAPGALKGYEPMGYGYQWWTMPREPDAPFDLGAAGTFAAMGVYGQQLWIVPSEKLVVVVQSATEKTVELDRLAEARMLVSTIAGAVRRR